MRHINYPAPDVAFTAGCPVGAGTGAADRGRQSLRIGEGGRLSAPLQASLPSSPKPSEAARKRAHIRSRMDHRIRDDFAGPAGSAPSSANWFYDLGTDSGNQEVKRNTNSTSNVCPDSKGHLVVIPDGMGHLVIKAINRGRQRRSAPSCRPCRPCERAR